MEPPKSEEPPPVEEEPSEPGNPIEEPEPPKETPHEPEPEPPVEEPKPPVIEEPTPVQPPIEEDEVKRTLTVTATAYTAFCDGCSGKTTTGLDLRSNPSLKVIAVDPGVIPLGSIVRLSSVSYPIIDGKYTASDTGGAIKGNKIDIFIPKEEDAIEFGKRKDILVEILREGYE